MLRGHWGFICFISLHSTLKGLCAFHILCDVEPTVKSSAGLYKIQHRTFYENFWAKNYFLQNWLRENYTLCMGVKEFKTQIFIRTERVY